MSTRLLDLEFSGSVGSWCRRLEDARDLAFTANELSLPPGEGGGTRRLCFYLFLSA